MTDKEVFEIVKNHLLSQGKKSLKDGDCVYRGEYGRKCAIGCLISDKYYARKLEGLTIESVDVQKALENSLSFKPSKSLLNRLQKLHDWTDANHWEANLNEYAFDKDGKYLGYLVIHEE